MANRNKRKDILMGYLRFEGVTCIRMTAENARSRAYAPHSGFAVGAAVLARTPVTNTSGHRVLGIFGGCNVENAAFDSSECAETGALMAAIAAGAGPEDIIACYVSGTARPCAGCLQRLAEFSPPDDPIMVHCGDGNDGGEWIPLPALLPNQFPDPANARAIAHTMITAPPGRIAFRDYGRNRSALLSDHERTVNTAAIACDTPWHGYAPYSTFPVRAIVLTRRRFDPSAPWATFTGFNIENAVHGSTVCAERVALCNALAHGVNPRDVIACAVIGPTDTPIAMCGECRQFISEFSPPEDPIMIFCGNRRGEGKWVPFTEILPRQFP